jgi:hypothetical protein
MVRDAMIADFVADFKVSLAIINTSEDVHRVLFG